MTDPLLFDSHPNDSRVTGPVEACQTLSERMGTGGGKYSARVWMTGKVGHMCRWTKMEKIYTLMESDYKDPPAILTEIAKPSPEGNKRTIFVMDRASFNSGEKAQYPPQIYEGGAAPCLIARGPCAVCYDHKRQKP